MQTPPDTTGHRRPMSDTCDVIINDTDDGVVLVVDHRDPKPYTMRFDFGASENLMMELPPEHVERAGEMKCNVVVKQQVINLCYLKIADRDTKTSFEMRYRVQCLVRNEKTGELEQVKGPSQSDAERKQITETLTLIIQKASDGYILFFESTDSAAYKIKVDFGKCENLSMNLGPNSTQEGAMIAATTLGPNGREPFVKMSIVDRSRGSCALDYVVTQSKSGSSHVDPTAALAAEKAAAEKAAAEKAAADKAAAEKAAAEKAAADKAAAEKAAAEKAAAEKAAAEKAAADKAAADKAAAEKAAADKAAAEKAAADKAAAEKAAAEKAAAEKAAAEKAAAEKAKAEAERLAKLEEIKKLLVEHQEEERRWRIKIEAEWKVRWSMYFKQWTESVCNLCRKVFDKDAKTVAYKQYLLHQECYDAAPKCTFCTDILVGEYVQAKGDGTKEGVKLHKECIQGYKESTRPTCAACGKQIMETKWVNAGGKQYHSTCREASPAAAGAA